MVLTSATRVDAPAVVAPMRGGLLSVANISPTWEDHYGFGIGYASYLCGTGAVVPAPCVATAPGIVYDALPKDVTGATAVNGWPFAVYAGVECDLFGRPYSSQATDKLMNSEDYLVSKAFYELTMFGEQPFTPVQTANTLPDNAVPGDLAEIIGELEQYAALNYAGTPVLHMNRRVAAVAYAGRSLVLDPLTGGLSTAQGTPVANASGYPDGIIFITGQVNIWRGPVSTYDVESPITNTAIALAERLYVASTECLLAYAGEITTAPVPTQPAPATRPGLTSPVFVWAHLDPSYIYTSIDNSLYPDHDKVDWDWGDGTTTSDADLAALYEHQYLDGGQGAFGDFVVSLTLRDSTGTLPPAGPFVEDVHVTRPPTGGFSWSNGNGLRVTFLLDATTFAPLHFTNWDWGDGSAIERVDGVYVTGHVYAAPGNYEVTATPDNVDLGPWPSYTATVPVFDDGSPGAALPLSAPSPSTREDPS